MIKEMRHREGIVELGPGVPKTLRVHFLRAVGFVCNTDGINHTEEEDE